MPRSSIKRHIMKLLVLFTILTIVGFPVISGIKSYGRYYVDQEYVKSMIKDNEICKSSFNLIRHPRDDRELGYEKLIVGSINCTRKIGPIGATIVVLKWTENGWKNDYAPIQVKSICDPPYDFLFDPFFALFSGDLNKTDCTIEKGNNTLKNWTIEDSIRPAIGETFFYGKYKYEMTWEIPGRKDPISGCSLIFHVKDADLLEFTIKGKRKPEKIKLN